MYVSTISTCCDTHRNAICIGRFSPCQNWDVPTPGSLHGEMGRPSCVLNNVIALYMLYRDILSL
jgi:hypothetical protein